MSTREAAPVIRALRTKLRVWHLGLGAEGVVALVVTALGLALRIEHALSFDGPKRGSDYGVYVQGVRWTLENLRPFNFTSQVSSQVSYQPPLWFAMGAAVLKLTNSERAIASLSVVGWAIRQFVLAQILRQAVPAATWSRVAVLALHAVLPLSVLIDGKVNPEGPHATLFALAAYALFRIERELDQRMRIAAWSAARFGFLAGLAILAKSTSATLMIAACLLLAWRAARALPRFGWLATWQRLLRPGLLALGVWFVVAGWWLTPNLLKYGNPFPHTWNLEDHSGSPIMSEPPLYRRPLGWALPFDWAPYLSFPIISSPDEPRPNFWSAVVTGTWTDFYNRGFCRLKGGETTEHVWGGGQGAIGDGPSDWAVSLRCLPIFKALLRVGLLITAGAVTGVVYTGCVHLRSGGRRGSMVLPLVACLAVLFILLFALVYPFDSSAVLNPRYLLSVQVPILACAGIALARVEVSRLRLTAKFVLLVVFLAIAAIAALLLYERFGH